MILYRDQKNFGSMKWYHLDNILIMINKLITPTEISSWDLHYTYAGNVIFGGVIEGHRKFLFVKERKITLNAHFLLTSIFYSGLLPSKTPHVPKDFWASKRNTSEGILLLKTKQQNKEVTIHNDISGFSSTSYPHRQHAGKNKISYSGIVAVIAYIHYSHLTLIRRCQQWETHSAPYWEINYVPSTSLVAAYNTQFLSFIHDLNCRELWHNRFRKFVRQSKIILRPNN